MTKFSRALMLGSFLALGIAGSAASDPLAETKACRECIIKHLKDRCKAIVKTTVEGALAGGAGAGLPGAACGGYFGLMYSCIDEYWEDDPCTAVCNRAKQEIIKLNHTCKP